MSEISILKSHYATDDFIDRIKKSYKLAIETANVGKGDIWSAIDGLRIPVHQSLIGDDRDSVRTMLQDPGTTDLFYGMDNLAVSLKKSGSEFEAEQEAHSATIEQVIVDLGRCFGIVRWVPPQMQTYYLQNNPDPQPELSSDQILDRIRAVIGFDIDFPNPFDGEMGKQTKYGLCSVRAAWAIYQAFRLHQETKSRHNASILEIGPGMGRTIYYAHKAGLKCTSIDLPLGVVAQACFLGATIGPERIFMLGDEESRDGKIEIYPSSHLKNLNDRFDAVLNVDSLVEMSGDEIDAYLTWINDHAAAFISINHEACKITMVDAIRKNIDASYHSRFPYRFMESHTEEIIKIASAPAEDMQGRSLQKLGSLASRLSSFAPFRSSSRDRR